MTNRQGTLDALCRIPTAAPTPEPMQADLRETIARIVDPLAFSEKYVRWTDPLWADKKAKRLADAVAKADAILAAMQAKSEPPRGWWLGQNGDYTPTEAMVEAGLETNHRHNSEENLIRSFIAMMQQAEIDGLIAAPSKLAHPSPSAPNPDLAGLVEGLVEGRRWLDYALHHEWTPDSLALACRALDGLDDLIASLR